MKKILFAFCFLISFQSFAQHLFEVEAANLNNTSLTGTSMHFNNSNNFRNFNLLSDMNNVAPTLDLTYQVFDGFNVVSISNLFHFEGLTGRMGIGTANPSAILHVDRGDNPQTLIGEDSGNLLGFVTINQQLAAVDNTAGILRVRDDGLTKFLVNETSATYQVEVLGDARITGVWSNSDKRLKKDIAPISDALSNINRLKPTTYFYKQKNKLATYLDVPEELQFGLIAQELKTVFPNLVKSATNYGENGEDLGATHTVNYLGLIPVLLAGIQEQQQVIETQAKSVKELQATVNKLEHLDELLSKTSYLEERLAQLETIETKMNELEKNLQTCCFSHDSSSNTSTTSNVQKAYLEQNMPNPFAQETTIRFYIPNEVAKAQIQIRNGHGQLLKTFSIAEKGMGSVALQEQDLPSGIYYYTLMIDGQLLDSKQMILMETQK